MNYSWWCVPYVRSMLDIFSLNKNSTDAKWLFFFKNPFSSFSLHRVVNCTLHIDRKWIRTHVKRWFRWVLFYIVSLCCLLSLMPFIFLWFLQIPNNIFPRIVAFAVLLRCLRYWLNAQWSHPRCSNTYFAGKNPIQFMHFPNTLSSQSQSCSWYSSSSGIFQFFFFLWRRKQFEPSF